MRESSIKLKDVFVNYLKVDLSQEADSCDVNKDDQKLLIQFENGGGGFFPYLKSDRWAWDEGEFEKITNFVNDINKVLNKYFD